MVNLKSENPTNLCAGPNPSNQKPFDLSKQCRNFRVSDRSKSIPLRILTVWHTPISKHPPGSAMISTPPAAWSYQLLISCVISASSKYKNMIPYACYSMLKTILISWKLTNIQHPHHVHEQVKVDTNPCRQPGYINAKCLPPVMPQWEQMYVYNIDNILYIYIYYQQYLYEGLPCLNLVDIDCRLWVSSLVSVYIYIWVGWEDKKLLVYGRHKTKEFIKMLKRNQ